MKIDASKLRALVKSHGLTNTNLAAQAGITRQALHAMLREDSVVEVRDRTVKGLTRALRLPDENLLSPDPLVGYKRAVARDNGDLLLPRLRLPTTAPRSMDEMFVPIRLVRMPDRDHHCQSLAAETDEEGIAASEEPALDESEELSVAQCLDLHRRVLITGEPGSGKSTVLREVARMYAQEPVGVARHPERWPVPLLVELADFAQARERDNDINLVRFVVTRTLGDVASDYRTEVETHLEAALRRGDCLVLLDGLDELGDDYRISAVLRDFVRELGRNQFVVTSRAIELYVRPWQRLGFVKFQVARWGEEDIQEFSRRWYSAAPLTGKRRKKRHDPSSEELTEAILSHQPLHALAANPLMLTILASLHGANATLPRRRVGLYGKIVEVMLDSWEASKCGARPGDLLHRVLLDARDFGWLLERLALGMQREGRVLRPRWWLNDSVQRFMREQMALEGDLVKEQAERVIRYLSDRTGLFVERSDSTFGFCHCAFQEYFAARGLLLEAEGGGDIISLLRPCLFHPQWEGVVVHVAASLSTPRATALLRVIVDDPDPAGRFLRRGQRLALRCLVNGAAVADRALLDQVFSDGEAIGASRWLGIAVETISLLGQLVATRYEAEAQQMLDEIGAGLTNRDACHAEALKAMCNSELLPGPDETADQPTENCLRDQDPIVSTAALHVLVDAIAEGQKEWSQPLVERIEELLMAVTNPCPHTFSALTRIVAIKEIHGGPHLDRLLGDVLAPFGDRISIAFIFGSVARLEQMRDSDIDLMLIGDIRLKDLVTALHASEQSLGRTVNPVLFSSEKFREQYRAGNPFLLDVIRKQKIYLKGTRDELTGLVADRSLD